jgi:peptidyl-prolyl cis-trans isomerase D
VETPFGWKVFLVKSATEESVRPFDEVKEGIRLEIAREKALDALFELSNAFQDALAGGSTIAEAAREIDVEVRKVDAVDASGRGQDGNSVEGIPPGRRFLATLFETSKDAQSDLVESEDGGYFLLEVDRIAPTRLRDFAEVRDAVVTSWRAERRGILANQVAGRIAEQSKAGVGLKASAEAMGYSVVSVGPIDRSGEGYDSTHYPADLAPIVFELATGDVGLADSSTGTAVAALVEVIAANREEQRGTWEQVVQELSSSARQDYEDTYLSSLRGRHGVSIDRGYIDALMAESQ